MWARCMTTCDKHILSSSQVVLQYKFLKMARTKKSGRKSNKQSKKGRNEGDGWRDQGGQRGNYKLAVRDNEMFAKYYKGHGLMPDAEWDLFYNTLKEPLPATFRITGSRGQGKELLKIIKGEYLSKIVDVVVDGQPVDPPQCLEWYPDELAWQINFEKKQIRSHPMLKALHTFLVSETESGNISRQEAVSMIPPILLNVKPHHKVLDMCAAPGSKTAQLIEYLHADDSNSIPAGFVVANDADNKRCYLMTHQVKRLQSPCCVVTNQDAKLFPNIRTTEDPHDRNFITYDRILCDVPCTGDGTLRKNPDAWAKWTPGPAINMHILQMSILKRGLELLAVGGRLVYSTCSFNPLENEAVIAATLDKCKGTVDLVDVRQDLPGLMSEPGLCSWKIMTKAGDWYDKMEDLPPNMKNTYRDSMFPNYYLHLDRCIRILPHHQNTGGFFIAVLEKSARLPWVKPLPEPSDGQSEGQVTEDGDETGTKRAAEDEESESNREDHKRLKIEEKKAMKAHKKGGYQGFKEDPFLFMPKDDPVWPSIKEFFQVSDSLDPTNLMFRSETGNKRALYYVCKQIKTIVECNRNRVKFISLGVKTFGRSPSPLVENCDFRIAQEGLISVQQWLCGRRITLSSIDLIILLKGDPESPFFSSFSLDVQQQLEKIGPGSILFSFKPSESDPQPACEILVCGWRGKTSVRYFGKKYERAHLLRMCGLEWTETNKKNVPEDRTEEVPIAASPSSDVEIPDKECDWLEPAVQEQTTEESEGEKIGEAESEKQEMQGTSFQEDGTEQKQTTMEISEDNK